MELFHGTTHNFNKFSLACGNEANHAGVGVYLTSCIDDAKRHYAGRGPDLRNRIGQLTGEIYNEYEQDNEKDISWDTCEQLAIDILDGKKKLLLRCEIQPEAKLFPLSMNHFLELYEFDEDDDDADYSEVGLAIALLCEAFDMDYPDACEMTTDEIFKWIRNSYNGEGWCGEIFRLFVELLGFDGVEYEDASNYFPNMVSKGTKHFVLYNPEMAVIKYKLEL
jgi:hypothetical protein